MRISKTHRILSVLVAMIVSFTMILAGAGMSFATPVFQGDQGTVKQNQVQDSKPDSTTVNVFKLQADKYRTITYKNNGGELSQEQLDKLGTNVKFLAGVDFIAYKITKKGIDEGLYKKMNKTPEDYQTKAQLEELVTAGKAERKAEETTDKGGKATFNLEKGRYWFVEDVDKYNGNHQDAQITKKMAVPFGLVLPMMNLVKVGNYEPGTVWMKTLNIYPKNVTGKKPVIDKDVTDVGNKENNYEEGKEFPWIINSTIPGNIEDYTKYEIIDNIDERLDFVPDSVKVYYADKNITLKGLEQLTEKDVNDNVMLEPGSYTLTVTPATGVSDPATNVTTKNGTTYKSNKQIKVSLLYTENGKVMFPARPSSSKRLFVVFKTKINSKAIMGKAIDNSSVLSFNNGNGDDNAQSDVPKVYTGGYRFIKQDIDDHTNLLGAIFTLHDSSTDAVFDGDAIVWTQALIDANKAAIDAGKFATDLKGTVTSDTNIPAVGSKIYFRSDINGEFEIKGLQLSTYTKPSTKDSDGTMIDGEHHYYIKEVKAPEDYAIPADNSANTRFNVDRTSYYKNPEEVNVGTQILDGQYADATVINNIKITVPQTGGIGTVIFAVVGLMLMGIALFAFKRRKKEDVQ